MILPANRQRLTQHPERAPATLKRVVPPESAQAVGSAPLRLMTGGGVNHAENAEMVIDLLHYLMARPSFDEIAQHVVLRLTPRYGTKAALISECQADGSLRHLGAFGLSPTSALPLTDVTLWDSSPLSDAIRTGHPVLCPQPGEVGARYPQMPVLRELADPTGAWPLALPGQLVGGIQLFFHAPFRATDLHEDVSGIGAVVALYLSLLRANGGIAPVEPTVPLAVPAGTSAPTTTGRPLTDRQRTILQHLAKGRTNIQIAHALGFSESTIRQETIAIYRSLHVHGRQEAVRQARLEGVLKD